MGPNLPVKKQLGHFIMHPNKPREALYPSPKVFCEVEGNIPQSIKMLQGTVGKATRWPMCPHVCPLLVLLDT